MAIPKATPYDSLGWKGLAVATSGATAQDGALLEADNVEMVLGDLRRARALRNFHSSTFTGVPLAIVPYQLGNGTYQLVIITADKVYSYVASVTGYTSEGNYTGAATRRVSWTTFAGALLFTDDTNPVQTYDGTTLAALGDLTGITARAIVTFWSFAFLLHTTEATVACPFRIKWSDVGDAADWNTGLASFVDLLDSYGEVQTGLPLGNKLLVYKDRAIYSGNYVGLPQVFDWNLLTARIGILAPSTLTEIGGIHFFLGQDNIYAYNGSGDPTPIGEAVIEEILGPRATANTMYLGRSLGFYIPWLKEYWLVIPEGVSEYPNKVYRYHLPTQTWWPRVVDTSIRALGEWFSSISTTWDMLPATDMWTDFGAAEPWSELGGVAETIPFPLIGVPSGVSGALQTIDETDTSSGAYFVTKDYLFHIATRMLEYRIEAKGEGGQLTVSYSTDEGASWTSMGVETLVGEEWQWKTWTLNLVSNIIRFKVEIAAADVSLRKRSLVGIEKRR